MTEGCLNLWPSKLEFLTYALLWGHLYSEAWTYPQPSCLGPSEPTHPQWICVIISLPLSNSLPLEGGREQLEHAGLRFLCSSLEMFSRVLIGLSF
jgi:hypothetical protein